MTPAGRAPSPSPEIYAETFPEYPGYSYTYEDPDTSTLEVLGNIAIAVAPAAIASLGRIGAGRAAEEVLVAGAAQEPRTAPFQANASGPRSLDDAVDLTRRLGVEIPEDIKFSAREGMVPEGADATYLVPSRVGAERVYEWESFYNRFEQIPVRIRPEVLLSDEHAVAVISHEMYELNNLRRLFAESASGKMTAPELGVMINPGIEGNLHDRAWDFADEMVKRLREQAGAKAR